MNVYAVILAGGRGKRFWPVSRLKSPKQFLPIVGNSPMIRQTIERITPIIPWNRILAVTGRILKEKMISTVPELPIQNIFLEPIGKNTAPAVAWTSIWLQQHDPGAVIAILPSDHIIGDVPGFQNVLISAAELAWKENLIVTLGIRPDRPETGYGYIQCGSALDAAGMAYYGARFIEKPPLEQAEAFVREGNYYWNSGIFLFSRKTILEAMARHLPELDGRLNALQNELASPQFEAMYRNLPSVSLDHGVLEKVDNLVVIPLDVGWDDVGTWGALKNLFPPDDQGNVALGNTVNVDSKNCIIYAQDRLVATIGLDQMIVVDTPDATLVCPLNKVQEVKDLVAELDRREMVESSQHLTVERPWGNYTIIDAGDGYKVKEVVVHPGKRLSLQYHNQRAEHWVVVQGEALVTIGQEISKITANESVYIPVKTPHRLENPGPAPLKIIEVQTGPYLEEDDIVRLNDDFWRG